MQSQGFERALLDSGDLMRRGYKAIIANMGKIIALITLTVAALVTFTEVGFCEFDSSEFGSSLVLMLIAAHVIYFSLENAGERLGEESEEYRASTERYLEIRARVKPHMIPSLRRYLSDYSRAELEYRKSERLAELGYSSEELSDAPPRLPFIARLRLFGIKRMKGIRVSPRTLLSAKELHAKSELYNPERGKIFRLFLSLLPSTACMCFTVSLMLSAKSDLGATEVINGILKLASLPIIGLKGYSHGYNYARFSAAEWIRTKSDLLLSFLDAKYAE